MDPLNLKIYDKFTTWTEEPIVRAHKSVQSRQQHYNYAKELYNSIGQSVCPGFMQQITVEAYDLLRIEASSCVCTALRRKLHSILRNSFDCTLQSTTQKRFTFDYVQLVKRVNMMLRMRMISTGTYMLNRYDNLFDECFLQFINYDPSLESGSSPSDGSGAMTNALLKPTNVTTNTGRVWTTYYKPASSLFATAGLLDEQGFIMPLLNDAAPTGGGVSYAELFEDITTGESAEGGATAASGSE